MSKLHELKNESGYWRTELTELFCQDTGERDDDQDSAFVSNGRNDGDSDFEDVDNMADFEVRTLF